MVCVGGLESDAISTVKHRDGLYLRYDTWGSDHVTGRPLKVPHRRNHRTTLGQNDGFGKFRVVVYVVDKGKRHQET